MQAGEHDLAGAIRVPRLGRRNLHIQDGMNVFTTLSIVFAVLIALAFLLPDDKSFDREDDGKGDKL
jgi:hypothetical protein